MGELASISDLWGISCDLDQDLDLEVIGDELVFFACVTISLVCSGRSWSGNLGGMKILHALALQEDHLLAILVSR